MFEKLLKQYTGYNFIKEYRFYEKRRWRFDYANIEKKIAIEIEGGAWSGGRHTRGKGFIGDMEKYNMAVAECWAVLRFTPSQMKESKTYEFIKMVIEKRL